MKKLLDLFCGAGGAGMGYHRSGFEVVGVGVDNKPYGMVECLYAKIRTVRLFGLWEDAQGSGSQWGTHKPPLSSLRSQASGNFKARELGEPRGTSALAGRDSHRRQWLSFNRRPARQPVPINGRQEGEDL